MKVGLKLWSTNPARVVDDSMFADFMEVLPRTSQSLNKFEKRPFEYTIHAPHEVFGFSPILNYRKSQKHLEAAVKAAKRLKADRIIMHLGYVNRKPDEETMMKGIKAAAKLAKSCSYGRILLENSVVDGTFALMDKGKSYICYTPEHMKEVLEMSGAGFCLDFEHVAITAKQLGTDFRKLLGEMLKLKPEYFHLSGTRLSKLHASYAEGHHLSIFNTDFNIEEVKKILQKAGKPVCLETPLDIVQRRREFEFLKK